MKAKVSGSRGRFLRRPDGLKRSSLPLPKSSTGMTRAREARHLNDRLVRDADKLWRFSVTGVSVACDWFKMTPRQYADRLEHQVGQLETETGRQWAAKELRATRATLMLHVI